MKSLSYLNKYLFKYKWRLILGVVFIVISNYFQIKMPQIAGNAVDSYKDSVTQTNDFESILWLSLQIGGLYVLMSIAKGVFLFLTRQTIIIMSRYIEYDLKNEIYQHYQRLNLRFYKNNNTGDLMNRISEDVSQVRQYLGPGLMYTINLAVLSTMIIYAMIQINLTLTLLVLVPLPIMSVLIYFVSSKMNQLSKVVQEEQSAMSTLVQETFSGIRVIKAYLREREMQHKFNDSADEYKRRYMRLVNVNALFMPTIVFLIGLSNLITIYYGGILVYRGEITTGNILEFVMFVNILTWPFASVGWVTSINQRAAASQERINEFLNTKPEITNPTEQALGMVEELVFDHVSFKYAADSKPVIDDVSFSVQKGQTLGIVGRTGSGKTTLLHLIMRQLDPTAGSIRVNKQDLRTINLDEYRAQSGVVPQDVFLFSDTIGNNISFGVNDREVSEEELIEVAKKAHVYHNIQGFKDGFNTLLGERGVNLSGGQKQRVSIARALIKKPQLLLLDDCLSAVDTETEDFILQSIHGITKDLINIIVSHRISSLRYADKIIVLDNGRVVEEGSHDELLQRNGMYAEMYTKQLSETTQGD